MKRETLCLRGMDHPVNDPTVLSFYYASKIKPIFASVYLFLLEGKGSFRKHVNKTYEEVVQSRRGGIGVAEELLMRERKKMS